MTNEAFIVSAACRVGKKIIVAPRHMHPLMHEQAEAYGVSLVGCEEGFIDQRGKFYTRRQAWKIAKRNNQIRFRCGGDTADYGTLYSENLY